MDPRIAPWNVRRHKRRQLAEHHPFASPGGNKSQGRHASYIEPLAPGRPRRLGEVVEQGFRCDGCGGCRELDDHEGSRTSLQWWTKRCEEHPATIDWIINKLSCPRLRYAIYLHFCGQLEEKFKDVHRDRDYLVLKELPRHLKVWFQRLNRFYNNKHLGLDALPSSVERLVAVRERLEASARQHGLQV